MISIAGSPQTVNWKRPALAWSLTVVNTGGLSVSAVALFGTTGVLIYPDVE